MSVKIEIDQGNESMIITLADFEAFDHSEMRDGYTLHYEGEKLVQIEITSANVMTRNQIVGRIGGKLWLP